MNDYKELVARLRRTNFAQKDRDDAADAIEQLVRERDAAVADLKEATLDDAWECFACKHIHKAECSAYISGECWEWRGVRE